MFPRMITRMGLVALTGLGFLLVGGSSQADTQGWPVAGRGWDYYGGSSRSSFGGSPPADYSRGGDSPAPYPAYPNLVPPSTPYYGSLTSEAYYRTSTAVLPENRLVRIQVRVPADAKIWFDGIQTNQTGTIRSFESPPLVEGREYTYQLRIQWQQDGKDHTQTRQILVHAGDRIHLTLGSSAGSPPAE